MKSSSDARIRRAIYLGFAAGAACAASVPAAVEAQDAGSTRLQAVEVTGSHIRSVDAETSNPVFVLDRKAIQATGATTLGELLEGIPAAAGFVTNPQTNDGGGNGGASVSLRGLGGQRTLVLLDGRRIIGTTFKDLSYVDVNTIPVNLVERVEVLKQGASAVYGSDAIGGVINIITRKNFKGGELETTWGESVRGDGQHQNLNATYGTNGPKGRLVLGLDYDRNDGIGAGRRAVTRNPTAYYYNQLSPNAGDSSRAPTGLYGISYLDWEHSIYGPNPTTQQQQAFGTMVSNQPGCAPSTGGSNPTEALTLVTGQNGTSGSQFRCFIGNFGPGQTDAYNFLPDNLFLTPAKRYGLFASGDYDVSPDIKFYGSGLFRSVTSDAQLAPELFDNGTVQAVMSHHADLNQSAAVPISGSSMYNPFGVDISSYRLRATAAGDRVQTVSTNTYQGTLGFRGELLDRFDWDLGFSYGRIDQSESDYGFLNFSNLANQLGPSRSVNGVPTCVDSASNPIPLCTPLDVLGTTGATVQSLATTANTHTLQDQSQLLATISGDVFSLWAGPVSTAMGFEYRAYHYSYTPDALEQAFDLSENNSLATNGAYNVREIFEEFRVPLLIDQPLVKSLYVTPGVRYSDYSSFGRSFNAKYGLEYRPDGDLLLRGTYADLFRAPTVNELFEGNRQDAPGFIDPCDGATSIIAVTGALANECGQSVAAAAQASPSGTFRQANNQASAVRMGNPNLQPERGFALDLGAVYNPSFYKPLSAEIDFYRYKLSNDIGVQGTQSSATACVNTGQFCNLAGAVNRDSTGNMNLGIEPTNNIGYETTSGVDLGLRLDYPKTQLFGVQAGNFAFTADTTYLQSWKSGTVVRGTLVDYESLAGQTDGGINGSFPRIKATFAMYWNQGPWSATIYDRYIGNVREGSIYFGSTADSVIDDGDYQGQCATSTADVVDGLRCRRQVGDNNYVDVTGSYKYAPLGTTLTLGVTDLFDAKAKFMASFVNGPGTGFPTDPSLYNIVGRAFFARVNLEFK